MWCAFTSKRHRHNRAVTLNGKNASVLGDRDTHEHQIHAHFPHWLLLFVVHIKRNGWRETHSRCMQHTHIRSQTGPFDAPATSNGNNNPLHDQQWLRRAESRSVWLTENYSKQFRALMLEQFVWGLMWPNCVSMRQACYVCSTHYVFHGYTVCFVFFRCSFLCCAHGVRVRCAANGIILTVIVSVSSGSISVYGSYSLNYKGTLSKMT